MKAFYKKALKIILITLILIMFAAIFSYGGYYFGTLKEQTRQLDFQDRNALSLNTDVSIFREVVSLIKKNYVHRNELKDQDLLYGAVEGMVNSLKDPYSVFFRPSDAQKFEEDIRGSFGGIGAEIGLRDNQLIIVTPLKNTPAEKVGLKGGDKIFKIDATSTIGLSVEEAVKMIRGEEGTSVVLTIMREGWSETKEFKIVRARIEVPTLDWEMRRDDKILYIQLYNFNTNAPILFYEAVLAGLLDNAQGIVLDLRNNPGGFLEVAVDLSGWFLKRGSIVVRERFSEGKDKIFRAMGNEALKNLPVVVLINEGSASASEILAGALRDHRNVKLIGKKTFGKGTVQNLETLKDGSSLKISVAEWLTPAGHNINVTGLRPDIEVEKTEDDIKNNRDPQLEKAIEVLKLEILNLKF